MDTQKVILVPLDDSEFSRTILAHVETLFPPTYAQLLLLRIAPPVAGQFGLPPRPISTAWPLSSYASALDVELARHPIYANQAEQSARATYQRALDATAADLERRGYSVACDVWFGDPAEAIVSFAQLRRVDLVAMATHSRSGVGHLLLGSVAEDVLRHSHVPVLLIHPEDTVALERLESDTQETTPSHHMAG